MPEYNCGYGCTSYNPSCDACDGYTNDPDTGWGGFTDHSIGKHFYSEQERQEWVKEHGDDHVDNNNY